MRLAFLLCGVNQDCLYSKRCPVEHIHPVHCVQTLDVDCAIIGNTFFVKLESLTNASFCKLLEAFKIYIVISLSGDMTPEWACFTVKSRMLTHIQTNRLITCTWVHGVIVYVYVCPDLHK